jgi:hypothetical protein
MSRFCRHNRFVERCPICRETVSNPARPAPSERSGRRPRTRTAESAKGAGPAAAGSARRGSPQARRRGGLNVTRERRAEDDGYRSPLATGLRASEDAERLAQEIAFADGRLSALATAPPDLYGEMRAQEDSEQAIWMCFLSAYLSPLEGANPFVAIRQALQADWRAGELPELGGLPLGPRTSHDPARGDATLRAYLQWAERAGRSQIGRQAQAFTGDPTWTPARRFERIFERLTLPGLGRMGRYELLLTLGRIGLCELHAETLCFVGAPGGHGDLATLAAKRVFGIGDQMRLEHRAKELAGAMSVPVEALDLALANWGVGQRATLGVAPEALDRNALERARKALDL